MSSKQVQYDPLRVCSLTSYIFALISFLCIRCAPVFSEMQSAKMLPKSGMEVTGLYSNTTIAEDGESDHLQNHIGARIAYGVSDNLTMRFGYETLFDGDESGHVVALGPKFPILRDRIAASIPIGTAFGSSVSTSENWQIQPTALFTIPLGENAEINPSAKWIYIFDSDQENLIAVNFGAGWSTDLNKWALRPEIGLMYDPGNSGHFTHYSIGFSFYPFYEDGCCPQKLRRNK